MNNTPLSIEEQQEHYEEANELNQELVKKIGRKSSSIVGRNSKVVQKIIDEKEKLVNSRHAIFNATTDFLYQLEIEFANNPQELANVMAITVTKPGHINIAGFSHELGICSASANKAKGIFKKRGNTFFGLNAAMDFAKAQTGYKAYSDEEIHTLMDAIPGKSNGRQAEIMSKLLQIPLAGYFEDNVLESSGEEIALWFFSSGGKIGNYYIDLNSEPLTFYASPEHFDGNWHGCSLILHEDKKSD